MDFGNRTATPVILSPSGPGIAGNTFSLTCSATLTLYAFLRLIPLPTNVPPPTFEWFFGPQGDASLPSGVTPTATAIVWMIGRTYTSTLQFSPVLNESHAGNYTCRLGAGRLASSMVVSVEGMQHFRLLATRINAHCTSNSKLPSANSRDLYLYL